MTVVAAARAQRNVERDLLILQLMQDGVQVADIAARVGICRDTVRRIAQRHGKQRRLQVPVWVPEHLREDYRIIAEEDGEENAASYCRRAKREAVMSYGPVEHGVR